MNSIFFLKAVRSGGYDMFEDTEDRFEVDTLSSTDSDDEEKTNSSTHKPLKGKMTIRKVKSTYFWNNI